MKQTAVEWLVEQLPIYGYNVVTVFPELIEQAKEIEKKQIIDAYGIKTKSINQDQSELITGSQYYNETFKKK
jgi:hypothetical protein